MPEAATLKVTCAPGFTVCDCGWVVMLKSTLVAMIDSVPLVANWLVSQPRPAPGAGSRVKSMPVKSGVTLASQSSRSKVSPTVKAKLLITSTSIFPAKTSGPAAVVGFARISLS